MVGGQMIDSQVLGTTTFEQPNIPPRQFLIFKTYFS